jgi:hypothetical protein
MNHIHAPFEQSKRYVALCRWPSVKKTTCAQWLVLTPSFGKSQPASLRQIPRLYTENGGEVLKNGPHMELAKKMLAESGYKGEPVVCLVAQDNAITKAQGEITADVLKRLGMNVDFVATDWGTVGQRRASKNEPGKGGWGMFHTWHAGADMQQRSPVTSACVPMATRLGLAGLMCLRSRRVLTSGLMPPTLMLRRRPSTKSTRLQWKRLSTFQQASSTRIKLGVKTSPVSPRWPIAMVQRCKESLSWFESIRGSIQDALLLVSAS